MELDTTKHYSVEGYGKIAWYTLGYEMIRDEDYEWSGIEYPNMEVARMVMVGDDTVHLIPVTDIEVIPEDSFCRECGQIGCGHNSYV